MGYWRARHNNGEMTALRKEVGQARKPAILTTFLIWEERSEVGPVDQTRDWSMG